MFGSGAVLTRAPAFSSALPHAAARWRERGGLLVVPRREDAARALLDEAGGGRAVLGREAVTFAGLRGRVAAAAGVPEPAPPAAIEVRLALREVLDAADLSAFGDSARAPGFLAAIERALAELREARVPPARAAEAATTPVAAAVAAIHAAAAETVPLPSDALWAVADAADGVGSFPPVTVSGFDDLVPGQWALLHALARTTPVEVVMPFDAARPAFEARRDRQARWEREAGAVERAGGAAAAGPPALAARLFEDGPPAAAAPPVRLVAAAGTRGMLRAALDEALAAIDGGVAPSRVALVVPRLAEVRDDLERLLDDWGVPARLTSRVRALEAPLALALTHLLRLGELAPDAPGALDHLLGWLRTPYSGADPAQVNLFEAGARRGGIATRGELMSRWEGLAIGPARRLVAAARLGPRAQLAAMVDAGWQALRRAGAADALPARADLRDRGALAALGGLAAAVSDAGEGEDDAAPTRPRGPLPPGVVGELIADLTFLAREETPGGLDVHDLASVRGSRYEVVVIAGLDGDGTPARPAPDPLLAAMREGLADVLPARAPGTTESRLRFVHAADAARSRLVLVRRAVNDEGRELAPSPYWLEACRVAGRPFDELDRAPGARGEVPDAAAAARSERDALRAMALDGEVAPGLLEEAAARRTRPVGLGPGRLPRPRAAARDGARGLPALPLRVVPRQLPVARRDGGPDRPPLRGQPRPRGAAADVRAHARRGGGAVRRRPRSTATGRPSRPRCPRSSLAERAGRRRRRVRGPRGAAAAPPAGDARPRGGARVGARAAALRARHGERAARRPRGAGRGGDRARSTASTSRATGGPPSWSTTSAPAPTSRRRATTS